MMLQQYLYWCDGNFLAVMSEFTDMCSIGFWIILVAEMNDVAAMCCNVVMVSFRGYVN